MNQSELNPDPLALEIAQEVYDTQRPLAAILFGSRARGDHRRDSDIDIMLITPQTPAEPYLNSAQAEITGRTPERYGREVPVQLVWLDLDEFQKDELYINSVITRALLDSTVISERPDEFRSRYQGHDAPPPLYEWSAYKASMNAGRNSANLARLMAARLLGDDETVRTIRLRAPWSNFAQMDSEWPRTRRYIHWAMYNMLAAAITGGGGFKKLDETMAELNARFQKMNGWKPDTRIPWETYENEELPAGTGDQEFLDAALADVESLRKLAMRLRRNTQKAGQQP